MVLHVYLHTNRSMRPPPTSRWLSGLQIHTGWYPDGHMALVAATQQQLEPLQLRHGLKPWNLLQVYKYE